MSKVIELLKDLDLKGAAKAWENMLQNPQSLNEMTTEDVIELILRVQYRKMWDLIVDLSKL